MAWRAMRVYTSGCATREVGFNRVSRGADRVDLITHSRNTIGRSRYACRGSPSGRRPVQREITAHRSNIPTYRSIQDLPRCRDNLKAP